MIIFFFLCLIETDEPAFWMYMAAIELFVIDAPLNAYLYQVMK